MNTNIYDIYRHRVQQRLVMEMSEGLITKMINKFKVQTNDTDAEIRAQILRFDQLSAKLPVDKRDIQNYNYIDLLEVTKTAADLNLRKAEQNVSIQPIISEPGLKVYRVNTPGESIAVRTYFDTKYEPLLKKHLTDWQGGIKWCVSQSYPGCLFYNYVDAPGVNGRKATFYLIESERVDKFFVSALQVKSAGDWDITSAKNDGDNPTTPEKIVAMYPQLKDHLKELIYKPLVLTKMQEDMLKNKAIYIGAAFETLSYDDKRLYISIGRELNDVNFLNLHPDLKAQYIEVRSSPTEKYNVLAPKGGMYGTRKTYIELSTAPGQPPPNVKSIYNFFTDNLTGQLKKRFIFTILRGGTYQSKNAIFPLTRNKIIEWDPVIDGTVVLKDNMFIGISNIMVTPGQRYVQGIAQAETVIANKYGEIMTGSAITPAAAQLIKAYNSARELADA